MYIITAIPGACSDIVSSVIDSNGARLLPNAGKMYFPAGGRKVLKLPGVNATAMPTLMNIVSSEYKSISSQYSISKSEREGNHVYVAISVSDDELDWCMNRLSVLYPRVTFDREALRSQADRHVENADSIISLRDILSGNLINCLSALTTEPLNEELYQSWLTSVLEKFPYNF